MNSNRKISVTIALILLVSTPAWAEKVALSAHLTSGQSAANGAAQFTYDTDTRQLQYFLTYDGLSGPANVVDIHGPAAAGSTGPVVKQLPAPASPISGTTTLSTERGQELLTGQYYVDVHTSAFPAGEIRGQIAKP